MSERFHMAAAECGSGDCGDYSLIIGTDGWPVNFDPNGYNPDINGAPEMNDIWWGDIPPVQDIVPNPMFDEPGMIINRDEDAMRGGSEVDWDTLDEEDQVEWRSPEEDVALLYSKAVSLFTPEGHAERLQLMPQWDDEREQVWLDNLKELMGEKETDIDGIVDNIIGDISTLAHPQRAVRELFNVKKEFPGLDIEPYIEQLRPELQKCVRTGLVYEEVRVKAEVPLYDDQFPTSRNPEFRPRCTTLVDTGCQSDLPSETLAQEGLFSRLLLIMTALLRWQ